MKKFLLIILLTFIFFGLFFYRDLKKRCDYYHSSFSGKILELKYTEQKTIAFKSNLKNDWIYLGSNIKYERNIEIGDTLVKNTNDYKVFLIKDGIVYNITSERRFEKVSKYCNCYYSHEE